MNPRPQTTPETRSALAPQEASRQEMLSVFAATAAEKPALPMNAGLLIRVQGDDFQATTLAGEPVTLALPGLPEKAATTKAALPANAINL